MGKLYGWAEKLGLRKYLKNIVQEESLLQQLTYDALHLQGQGTRAVVSSEQELIVTLTSFGDRVYDVYLTIESLLQQSLPPNRIILWLNAPWDINTIPRLLQKQMKRGLEVHIVPDYKSYDKLVHALKAYPEAVLITVDDDVIYPFDFIEHLALAHQKDPEAVLFYRGHQMVVDSAGEIAPYLQWKGEAATTEDSILNFPTGCGGILYPPHSLHPDATNASLFQKLAPTADDIWFRAMSLVQGTHCRRVAYPQHAYQRGMLLTTHQQDALFQHNTQGDGNDKQVEAVFSHYDLFKRYKKEAE